jgi:hypothetical protein
MSDAIRATLFRNTATTIDTIRRRLNEASAHLEHHSADGVLGALDGVERELARVRCLVSVSQDFGPKEQKKK